MFKVIEFFLYLLTEQYHDIPMVQPHPPREPSHDRVRPRPRVKNGSAGKNRMSSAGSTKGKNCAV